MADADEARKLEEAKLIEIARPVDYSFKKLKILTAVDMEGARESRVGQIPEKGSQNKKYLTRAVWLNNNKLKSIENMDVLVNSILEQPERLGWIDFSFNFITSIDDIIKQFPNLKIVYFHGNQISDVDEVLKLRALKELRSVTFHGNPISEQNEYRQSVLTYLPQIVNLDFSPVIKTERFMSPPPDALKKVRALEEDAA